MTKDPARQTSLEIELGKVQMVLRSLNSTEYFSKPFELKIDMLSEHGEADLLPHLGKPALVTIKEDNEVLRYFHGILVDGELIARHEDDSAVYRLTLRPKAWLHEQGRYFRMFQNMSVRDIIIDTLKTRCGIEPDIDKLKGGNRRKLYCVQYGESDFGFACRLMEEEGIYYYYRHTIENHVLVLCDSSGAHAPGKVKSLAYAPSSGSVFNVNSLNRFNSSGAYVQDWREHVTTGGELISTASDFDFKEPHQPLLVSTKAEKAQHPNDAIEVYSFPGRFYDKSEGEELVKTSLAARRANRRTYRGASRNGALAVGDTFTLTNYERFDGDYLLTTCRHSVTGEGHRSGMGGGGGYLVHFEAVPRETVWKAPQTRPRPVVMGPETAIVTGKSGEEIYCDAYGRIKVQFHWDRDGKRNQDSSCWIRVAQLSHLGSMNIPRVGHEVVVDFINGDPDRPIILGRVYNETENPSAKEYPLPKDQTRSIWRSRTTKYKDKKPSGARKMIGDCDPGYNEISFEDLAEQEEIRIQAQRDLNTRIQHDETHFLGNNQTIEIGDNRKTEIGGNDTTHVGGDMEVQVDGEILIESKKKITLKVGSSTITMTEGKIVIESGTVLNEGHMQSQIASGGNFVQTGPAGVTVKGTMVLINSGGAKAT